jgi:predicted exporter
MRTTLLIERYRRFAARTRLSMAILALSLFAAIGLILVVGARASHAAFLDSEARNVATIGSSGDVTLIVVVALVFAGTFASLFAQSRNSSPRQ